MCPCVNGRSGELQIRAGMDTMITFVDWSRACNLLSSMYLCKPDKEILAMWKVMLSDDVPECLSGLKTALDDIEIHSEQEIEDLLWEYTGLFIGPYNLPCPPWESVYTSPKRLMMQDSYSEVQKLYSDSGLILSSTEIMADHIGAELNFLGILCQKLREEPAKKLCYANFAKSFLDKHLMRWIPQFVKDMEEAAESSFYKKLAQATGHLLCTMAESL